MLSLEGDLMGSCIFDKETLTFGGRLKPTFRPITTIDRTTLQTRRGERVLACSHCATCFECREAHLVDSLPWTPQELAEIQRLQPLKHFLTSRQNNKDFGNFARYETFNDAGELSTMTLVYHPSMRQDWEAPPGSIWSVGAVYDVDHDGLAGVFNGLFPKPDKTNLANSLTDGALTLAHPFSIFCAVLDVQVAFAIEEAFGIYTGINHLEQKFGLPRSGGDPWSMNQEDFRDCVETSARLENRALYLRKQVNLFVSFKEFLLDANKRLSKVVEDKRSLPHQDVLSEHGRSYRTMTTNLDNLGNALGNLQNNMELVLKRIETCSFFLTTLMNYRETKDSSYNSSVASSIALVTMTFLPATAVATFFSMGMMNADGNGTLALSSSFWVYWAVTLPLTATTILGWYAWVKLRPKFKNGLQHTSAKAVKAPNPPLVSKHKNSSEAQTRRRRIALQYSSDIEKHVPDMPPAHKQSRPH